MTRGHVSDDELIAVLYGTGNADHLAGCSECVERFTEMRRIRAESVSTPEISGRMLAKQRQGVLDRLERPGSPAWRWVPVGAAAALLGGMLYLYQPSRVSKSVTVNTEADAQLFTDVYSMEREVEPRAAAPIRALFQETSFEPAAAGEERQ